MKRPFCQLRQPGAFWCLSRRPSILWIVFIVLGGPPRITAQLNEGQASLVRYFETETKRIEARGIAEVTGLADWKARRMEYRKELFEMLGLSRLPDRGDLRATVTGRISLADITVEKITFQSLPGLYVTANFYLPARIDGPLPTVLYLCGHDKPMRDGIKSVFQHHGAWFARHGYACLIVDTLQLGEIKGIHHGTHNLGMWWWNARGYTPAGVEAWNNIRALDYLESRPEVDRSRFGATGISGGGSYTWVLAALDDRIKVAVPVAGGGVTDLQAQVVEGKAAGHCDCVLYLNTHRLDFPTLHALIAPRPLLIESLDKDRGIPLEGVMRLHAQVRKVYRWYGAEANLGLVVAEGPHRDGQALQVSAFRWFNRHLKGDESLIRDAAEPVVESHELRVFSDLPGDQINTSIQERFVPAAPNARVPADGRVWAKERAQTMKALQTRVFGGWPASAPALDGRRVATANADGVHLEQWTFVSQEDVALPFYSLARDSGRSKRIRLRVLSEDEWPDVAMALETGLGGLPVNLKGPPVTKGGAAFQRLAKDIEESEMLVLFPPRGVGPTSWGGSENFITQVRRRFVLLGQTVDGMRVWDIRRCLAAVRRSLENNQQAVIVEARDKMAVNAIYAALWDNDVALDLNQPSRSHKIGPDYLNVLRFLDVPQAIAMAVENSPVILRTNDPTEWDFPRSVATRLGWPADRLRIIPGK